ncbi:DNA repair protein SWI5 homolog isoform X2 [Emys orbicularis]|uniref:DNA repair protein SWI5 homolog isoform X2 n=1 Tax=Emys orbicularis TaxID=82168 RepID=UPI0031FC4853
MLLSSFPKGLGLTFLSLREPLDEDGMPPIAKPRAHHSLKTSEILDLRCYPAVDILVLPLLLPTERTPTGILRNCNAGFKSPIQSPRSCQSDGVNKEALQHEVEELKQKDLALDQEISQLLAEGYSLEELEKHISLLHEYNDIKDTGQMLLGKLGSNAFAGEHRLV